MKVLKDFVSSNVKAPIKYNPDTGNMYVQFLRKKESDAPQVEYIYKEVKSEEFQLLEEAESVGSVLRKVIKGKEFIKTELPEIF